ncbi:hypothetical protein CEQ21_07205 (plasmid) [Niallia circulans]|uniref:Uncharacterized protein n=1 Tax=Niallia circulans TaxID=1397 RepID=A0A553SQT0_NIACI|nr:hypothetical protein [Niallia circulans]TRZ39341.1 hypothetical protein CEQ21_07205 [Niallia circulans]
MKKQIIGLFVFVLLLGTLLPTKLAFASENDGQSDEELVLVTLYSDEEQNILAEVPKSHEQEYIAKLENDDFRTAEIQKSLEYNKTNSINVSTVAKSSYSTAAVGLKPYVRYYKLKEVLQVVDHLDNSRNWLKYASNPLTDYVIGIAISVIKKNPFIGTAVGATVWSLADMSNRQDAWWKESAYQILRGQIRGVKLTVTPNNTGSNYPAAYRILSRY